MVGMGREKLSKLRVRSHADPLRRSHRHYGPGFTPDRLPHGALRPLLPSAGMDHRQQRLLVREPDPHSPRNRPDPPVDRLATRSGPPNEDRSAYRDHIRRNDLVVPLVDPLSVLAFRHKRNRHRPAWAGSTSARLMTTTTGVGSDAKKLDRR